MMYDSYLGNNYSNSFKILVPVVRMSEDKKGLLV